MSQFKTAPALLKMRVPALADPFYFEQMVLGHKDMTETLHGAELDHFIDNCIAGKWQQFIEWPRGFFKTSTFTQGCGMWFVCPVSQEDTDFALTPVEKGGMGFDETWWFDRVKLHDQNLLQLVAMEINENAKKKVSWIKTQRSEEHTS